MTSSEPTTPGAGNVLLSPVRPSPAMWFTAEIQQMMHGLGDCRKPLTESATIIEEIVHQQLASVLYMSEDAARTRNARFIGIEDFLFLLRKDKVKLRRLLRYLELRDVKQSSAFKAMDDDENNEQSESSKQPKKRKKICMDFLSIIDQTGELLALFDETDMDEVKLERAMRAEYQAQNMDVQQYMEFSEARQASFTPRFKSQRFKDWLLTGVSLDIKPNPLAVEVLGYLAYETVAQIVDLALIVKRDSCVEMEDPFSRLAPPSTVNPSITMNPANPGTQGSTSKSPSRSTSPLNSPPSTPTTPNSNLSSSQGSLSLTGSSSKSKHKKKKKLSSSESRNMLSHQPIQPADIREALRRYTTCHGPFAAFSKAPIMNKAIILAM